MSCTVVQLAANGSGWSSSSKMLDGFKVIEYETKKTDHNVLRLYDPQGSGGTRSVNLGGKRTAPKGQNLDYAAFLSVPPST